MTTRSTVRRFALTVPSAALVLGLGVAPASAAPTCSDVGLGVEVHGHHVVRDYVVGGALDWPPSGGAVGASVAGVGAALPGGPGPGFHFPNGVAPGASFCNPQSQSPGLHPGA